MGYYIVNRERFKKQINCREARKTDSWVDITDYEGKCPLI
jgi:hypothetical protein